MKKSIFCVGQKVIYGLERKSATVRRITPAGAIQIVIDNSPFITCRVKDSDLKQIPDYLDNTSFFYHHSRFADFQGKVIEAFRSYMFSLETLEDIADQAPPRIVAKVQGYADEASEEYAAAVALRDLASMNMAQWGSGETGYTLNHHFPFVNPENILGY